MALTFNYDIENIKNAPMWAKEDTQLRIEALLSREGGLPKGTEKDVKKLGKASEQASKSFDKFAAGVDSMVDGAATIAGSFLDTSGRIDSLNPVVDTLFKLVGTGIKAFGNLIPVVGDGLGQLGALGVEITSTLTQALATELDEIASGFRGIASRGAVLNGNLEDLTQASARAGFGIENLGGILDNNASVLMAFGDASEGARAVLKNLAALRDSELYMPLQQLGFTVEELADVAGDYYTTLVRTGRLEMLRAGNETEVARQTGEYAKNLALISRLTGRNVKEIQEEIRQRQEEGFIIVNNSKIAERSGQEVLNVVNAASSLFNDPELNKAIRMTLTDIGLAGEPFEALLRQFPGAREALSEFQSGLKDGTVTEDQAKGFLDEIIAAFKAGGQDAISLAEFSPYGQSAVIQAINTSAAAIIDFSNSTDKNLTTADGAIQKFLNSAENNVGAVITLEEEMRSRALMFQEKLGANVDALSAQLLEAYSAINDIMQSFVDPNLDTTDVLKTLAEDKLGGIENSMNQAIDTAYMTVKELIVDNTGAPESVVDAGLITTVASGSPTAGLLVALQAYIAEYFKGSGSGSNSTVPVSMFRDGSRGVENFGAGQLAMLHGKEAVIPAPRGSIPVDLGDTLAPLQEMMTNLTNSMSTGNNSVAQEGVNSVQSKEMVSKLNEMIGVLKTIADGQYSGNTQFGKEIRRLGSQMSTDLFR